MVLKAIATSFAEPNGNKAKVVRTCSAGSPTSLSKPEEFVSVFDNVIYSNTEPGKNIPHYLTT